MLFGNKRKAFTNALTTAIDKNKNITIEDILLHQDLSNTIRNESDVLYNKIFDNENKYLNEIFQYALFKQEAPEKYQENNKVNQINHNASNFLENCGKRFISKVKELSLNLINEKLDSFISEQNPTRLDRLYAGHFQRFLENFIRLNAFDNLDDILRRVIPFVIGNCRILAYQQLLTRILADFSMNINDKTIHSILTKMLARAYGAVKYIDEKSKKKLNTSVYLKQMKRFKKEKVYDINQQPLNFNGDPIPLLEDIIKVENTEDNITPSIDSFEFDINWKEQVDDNIDFNDIEDAEIEAYLLIMSIRTATNEQQDLLKQFHDDSDDYQLIESLLYCGTQCNETSLISLEAFKLLDIIFNGSIALSIEPWKLLEIDKADLKFYKKYADTFNFRPCNLSYKMIHGLPIFWNHRYNLKNYELSEEEKKQIKVSNYFSDIQKDKKMKRKREKGETAIEIVQPCLICEPPLSSVLIYTVTNIFVMLSDERKRLRQIEDQTIEIRERMLYIDGAYYDFYTHHFRLTDGRDVRILDLLDEIIPLPSSDKKYEVEEEKIRRVPLSGFIIDFFLRMNNPNINTFFDVSEENQFSKLSRATVMQEVSKAYRKIYIYSSMLDYDKISRNSLYNIPVHSEFAFDNAFEDEEDPDEKPIKKIKVYVDEFDEKNKKKKKIKKRKIKNLPDNDQQQTSILQSSSSSDIKVKVVEDSNEKDTEQLEKTQEPKSEEEISSVGDEQKGNDPNKQKPKSGEENSSSDDEQKGNDQPKPKPKSKEENSSSDDEQKGNDQPKQKPKSKKENSSSDDEQKDDPPKQKQKSKEENSSSDDEQKDDPPKQKQKSKEENSSSDDEQKGNDPNKPKPKSKEENNSNDDEQKGNDQPKQKQKSKKENSSSDDEQKGNDKTKQKQKSKKESSSSDDEQKETDLHKQKSSEESSSSNDKQDDSDQTKPQSKQKPKQKTKPNPKKDSENHKKKVIEKSDTKPQQSKSKRKKKPNRDEESS